MLSTSFKISAGNDRRSGRAISAPHIPRRTTETVYERLSQTHTAASNNRKIEKKYNASQVVKSRRIDDISTEHQQKDKSGQQRQHQHTVPQGRFGTAAPAEGVPSEGPREIVRESATTRGSPTTPQGLRGFGTTNTKQLGVMDGLKNDATTPPKNSSRDLTLQTSLLTSTNHTPEQPPMPKAADAPAAMWNNNGGDDGLNKENTRSATSYFSSAEAAAAATGSDLFMNDNNISPFAPKAIDTTSSIPANNQQEKKWEQQGGVMVAPSKISIEVEIIKTKYLQLCEGKAFLVSNAVSQDTNISAARGKLEITHGAKLGAGATSLYLKSLNFPDEKKLGAGSIMLNDELAFHHKHLDNTKWVKAYTAYAAKTKYGVLIMGLTPENFAYWALSKPCLDEVKDIPKGRLFVYIEHTEEDEGGRQGYIIHVNDKNDEGATTVESGKGYMIFGRGKYYHGELKYSMRNGKGKSVEANGAVYVGEYKDNKRNGKGSYKDANGNAYVGEYKDGKKNGMGTFTWTSGHVYIGEYKEGKKNGMGTYTYGKKSQWAGDMYVGEYNDNKQHGIGRYIWASGNEYIGEMKDDNFHGKGKKTFKSGKVQDGMWENNKFRR